jgi:glutamate dehydrogenase/leucine dehydrogenase
MEYEDNSISVIPDFIANCGMARTFAYCMQNKNEISSAAIFKDVSETIKNALQNVHSINGVSTQISEKALTMAIKKLI